MNGKQKMFIVVISLSLTLCVVAAVSATTKRGSDTPLYTFRMEQASSEKNFLPTERSTFAYSAKQGYTLVYDSAKECSCITPLATGYNTCQDTCPETCEDDTCEETTCPNTCSTCTQPTCPATCPNTCLSTCPSTCTNTCPETCEATCASTCSTCVYTCWWTCSKTCDTCYSTSRCCP
ncbi:MAG: hypothetical protein HXS54_17280 [Theionarchaea archaeon]|nr:hypothetical protein [Theionarchaea archaeon]